MFSYLISALLWSNFKAQLATLALFRFAIQLYSYDSYELILIIMLINALYFGYFSARSPVTNAIHNNYLLFFFQRLDNSFIKALEQSYYQNHATKSGNLKLENCSWYINWTTNHFQPNPSNWRLKSNSWPFSPAKAGSNCREFEIGLSKLKATWWMLALLAFKS